MRFDRIFQRHTGCATRDRLLQRLHTNGSENDIRCQVTKRHVSGGTRSDIGRDAFLGLAKACRNLGIGFSDYLGAMPVRPLRGT